MKRTLPEIIALGAYDAALVHKNVTETHPRRVLMYEIESVLEDGGSSYIDGVAHPVEAGTVIIGKPGQIRHTVLPFKCLYLHLLVEDGELSRLLDGMPDLYRPASGAVFEALERLIAAYTTPEPDAGMQIAAELCGLLATLVRDTRLVAGTARERKRQTEIIEQAIAYMNANLCRKITLAEIADHVYLSRIYFHRLFLAATGRTPYRYLLERRLAHAQKLLMTTELSVGEVARECGFSSQSYFHQVFSRELGETPLGYKRHMSLRY